FLSLSANQAVREAAMRQRRRLMSIAIRPTASRPELPVPPGWLRYTEALELWLRKATEVKSSRHPEGGNMQLGASLPVVDIGPGPTVVRDYAQAAEGLGYAYLVAPDHVLGANPAADHAGRRVGTTANPYHDPFVLFGFLAGCTQRVGFAAGVLILAQRQAVLVAKQAASLDVLCGGGGRFRLGIGVGWNEVEFVGL